jgi:thiamine kinase-like enzyme
MSVGELALCHNDPWPGNVVMVDRAAVLVDWEYSGMNDPAWDLADFTVEADLDRGDEDLLLRTYAGATSVESWRERVTMWKPVVDLMWSVWSVAEFEAGNPADDFVSEAERRLRRAERALAD